MAAAIVRERPADAGDRLSLVPRRVAKNTLSQIAAYGLNYGTKAVVLVLVARWLGPRPLGDFSVAWTLASMLSFFAPLGLSTRLTRELTRRDRVEEVEESLTLAVLLGFIFAAGVVAAAAVLDIRPALGEAITASGLYIALTAPVRIFRSTFHARERMELETVTVAVEGLLGLAGAVVALQAGWGVPGAMLGLGVGQAANLVVSGVLYRRLYTAPRLRFVPSIWPALLRVSFPMGVSYAFTTLLLRFDLLLLGAMRSATETGIYSAASVVTMAVPIIATGLSGSLYPVLSRAGGTDDPALVRTLDGAWKLLVAAGVVAAALVAVLASPAVEAMYGSAFAATATVLAVLAWVIPLRFVNTLLGTALNAVDRQNRRTTAVGVAAVANLLANLALIPSYGYWGAVAATLVTEVLLAAILVVSLRPIRLQLLRPGAYASSFAAAAAAVVTILPGHVAVRGLAGAVTAGIMWAAVGVVSPQAARGVAERLIRGLGQGIALDLRGLEHATKRTAGWMRMAFAGLPAPGGRCDRILRVEIVASLRAPGPGEPDLPAGVAGDGLWMADHAGRAAFVALGEPVPSICVDKGIDPHFFHTWVYLPALRAALWRSGGCLVRASSAVVGGHRVVICGWSTSGKTATLLELMRGGASFGGDDWLSVSASGELAAVSARLYLRDPVRLPLSGGLTRLGIRARMAATANIERLARVTDGSAVSGSLRTLCQAARDASSSHAPIQDVVPGVEVAGPGKADLVVVLCRETTAVPQTAEVASLLAHHNLASYRLSAELAALLMRDRPDLVEPSLFADPIHDARVLARTFGEVPVLAISPAEPSVVARRIMEFFAPSEAGPVFSQRSDPTSSRREADTVSSRPAEVVS